MTTPTVTFAIAIRVIIPSLFDTFTSCVITLYYKLILLQS